MDLEFKRKIEERMREIPAPLAEAIRNSGWENIVFEIGRRYSLHVDDIGEIQNELILVLTGITHPDEFRSILINEIGIPSDKTDLIINDINEKINEKIKDFLKNHLDEEEKEEPVESQEESEENIKSFDKVILKKAGIKLGDEPDDEEVTSRKPQVEDDEEKFITLPAPEVARKASPTPVPVIPDIATKLQNSAVFKNKSSNYLDPYREPVE